MATNRISIPAYDGIAGWYEKLAWLYSGGQIPASKRVELTHLSAGDRVLYLGVGSGEDALQAARIGCTATCIDLSQGMLARLRKRLVREGLVANLICGDALEHDRFGQYDAVVANYFLNCFVRETMLNHLKHATDLLRPGGLLLIADVAPPRGRLLARWLNLSYLKPSMAFFRALSMVPWHENYAYEEEFPGSKLKLLKAYEFNLLACGPPVFRTLVAEKTELHR